MYLDPLTIYFMKIMLHRHVYILAKEMQFTLLVTHHDHEACSGETAV